VRQLPGLLEAVGLVLVAVAAFVVALPAGLLVSGVLSAGAGYALERRAE